MDSKDNSVKLVNEFKKRPSSKELTETIEAAMAVESPFYKGTQAFKNLFKT